MSSNQHVDNLEPLPRESYQLFPGLRRFHWVNKDKREEPCGDLAALHRSHHARTAETHDADLRRAETPPGEEPAEPSMLGHARSREPHAGPAQVLERLHRRRPVARDEQRDRGRRRQAEDETRGLTGHPRTEPQHRVERRRRQIRLALRERLGGGRLGASRAEHDVEPLAAEVALRVRDAEGEILG